MGHPRIWVTLAATKAPRSMPRKRSANNSAASCTPSSGQRVPLLASRLWPRRQQPRWIRRRPIRTGGCASMTPGPARAVPNWKVAPPRCPTGRRTNAEDPARPPCGWAPKDRLDTTSACTIGAGSKSQAAGPAGPLLVFGLRRARLPACTPLAWASRPPTGSLGQQRPCAQGSPRLGSLPPCPSRPAAAQAGPQWGAAKRTGLMVEANAWARQAAVWASRLEGPPAETEDARTNAPRSAASHCEVGRFEHTHGVVETSRTQLLTHLTVWRMTGRPRSRGARTRSHQRGTRPSPSREVEPQRGESVTAHGAEAAAGRRRRLPDRGPAARGYTTETSFSPPSPPSRFPLSPPIVPFSSSPLFLPFSIKYVRSARMERRRVTMC